MLRRTLEMRHMQAEITTHHSFTTHQHEQRKYLKATPRTNCLVHAHTRFIIMLPRWNAYRAHRFIHSQHTPYFSSSDTTQIPLVWPRTRPTHAHGRAGGTCCVVGAPTGSLPRSPEAARRGASAPPRGAGQGPSPPLGPLSYHSGPLPPPPCPPPHADRGRNAAPTKWQE